MRLTLSGFCEHVLHAGPFLVQVAENFCSHPPIPFSVACATTSRWMSPVWVETFHESYSFGLNAFHLSGCLAQPFVGEGILASYDPTCENEGVLLP